MPIKLKRAYAPPSAGDGFRILVDRLWPRGISKEKASIDLWLREIAPSDSLRKWFSHDPAKWQEFERKYREELKSKSELLAQLKKLGFARKEIENTASEQPCAADSCAFCALCCHICASDRPSGSSLSA